MTCFVSLLILDSFDVQSELAFEQENLDLSGCGIPVNDHPAVEFLSVGAAPPHEPLTQSDGFYSFALGEKRHGPKAFNSQI